MKRLENKFVNVTAEDLVTAVTPLGGQRISGSAQAVRTYETKLAETFGVSHAIAVNSGTVSIYCALHALGVGPEDEVIAAPSAVLMSVLPATLLGAKVCFADTRKLSMGLDPEDLLRVITPRTKVVISVPLWGYPIPTSEISALCKERGIYLLEDIAQAHGTTWKGQLLGTFGDVGCMSTHERKLITTGEGGAILTDSSEVAQKVKTLRRYGIAPEGIGAQLGLNFKLPAVSAALGATQAGKLAEKIEQRNRVASQIRRGLAGQNWIQEIPVDSASTANYYGMVMACDERTDVKKLEAHLEKRGVVSDTWRYGYKPLYEYPLYTSAARDCPNAEEFIRRVVTLPSHEGMGADDVRQVVDAVLSFPR